MSEAFFSLAIRNGYWELPEEEIVGRMVLGMVLEESSKIIEKHKFETVCFPRDWFNLYAYSLRNTLEPLTGGFSVFTEPSPEWTTEDRVFVVLQIITKIEEASKVMPKGSYLVLHYWYMRRKNWFIDLLIGIEIMFSKPGDFLEANREQIMRSIVSCPVTAI